MNKKCGKFLDFGWSGLALVLLTVPTLAFAGHENVINADWVVTDSRQGLTEVLCVNDTCLRARDQFEIQVNRLSSGSHGSGWFVIDRDGSRLAAFEALIRIHKNDKGALMKVDVYFLDDLASGSSSSSVPLKRLRITPVDGSNSASCKQQLRDLDRGDFRHKYDYGNACPEDAGIVAHWSVCSLDSQYNCDNFTIVPSTDTSGTLGVPDDGQGAGGPPE